eukprot:1162099-Pelagomonas_calceolata.AAC.7
MSKNFGHAPQDTQTQTLGSTGERLFWACMPSFRADGGLAGFVREMPAPLFANKRLYRTNYSLPGTAGVGGGYAWWAWAARCGIYQKKVTRGSHPMKGATPKAM